MGKGRQNRRRAALCRYIGQFDSESLWLLLAAAGAGALALGQRRRTDS